jgi:Type III secretion system, cytoplasmic E component of needle
MGKAGKKTKEIQKLNADAYTKNIEARWDKINADLLKVDKDIKAKNDRLIQALEDLKNRNKRLKDVNELEKNKLMHT